MKEWFQSRQEKRVTVETLLPDEKGGSYTGTVAWVSDDAVVLQLPNQSRLIAFRFSTSPREARITSNKSPVGDMRMPIKSS